jgi:hypothetical protein
MTMSDDQALNDVLASLGWRTAPRRHHAGQGKRVYDSAGNDLGDLTAHEVWDLLRERELVPGGGQ